MSSTGLMVDGSESQQEELDKDKQILYGSMRGLGNTYLSGLFCKTVATSSSL